MSQWFWYAISAAILYGLHQVFTKMASNRIGDGFGSFLVEATATITILVYLLFLWGSGNWSQTSSGVGIFYSVLTGICVGAGTVFFFLLFQKGGPLSAVPTILAGGATLMAIIGILFFKEAISWPRLTGIVLSIISLILLKK
ncbi:MAG: EamA family transporter [Verrucomicrobiae bacterium]|nr:EamA family transporter [Verrucomicrobiae bacterium]